MQYFLKRCRVVCWLMIALLILECVPLQAVFAGQDPGVQSLAYNVVGNTIVISYDMSGSADEKYNISLTLKKRLDSTFSVTPVSVTGDIGRECTVGNGKRIVWDFLKDFPNGLEGTDYYFRMNVETISGGNSAIWWIIGGAAVTGGAAALLLKSSPSQTEQGLPKPIGRP